MKRDHHRIAQRRAGGFTLVEVLIVVGIIGLLATLLAPAMLRVRVAQARVNCASSLHQLSLGVWSYAINNGASLPAYYLEKKSEVFDTFALATDEADLVNLGLVTPYIQKIQPFYCPTQTVVTSPSLACNGPDNRWTDDPVASADAPQGGLAYVTAGLGGGTISPMGKPPKPDRGGPPPPPPGLNSAFAVRTREFPTDNLPNWKTHNYASKVIYSDFFGVDKWPGKGRFKVQLLAPHQSEGCNRLFGNGSVQWTSMEPVNALRPVGVSSPKAKDLYEYYQLLDVLP